MIYVNQENVPQESFLNLLESTKTNIQNTFILNGTPTKINGVEFEGVVFNEMINSSKNTDFNGHIQQTGLHSFPDIIAKKLFGVEVKMTVSDRWTSTGNSVLESTRISDVETIYIFFGKFGNQFEAKYRKYQECLYDVGVTHSPRYKIDMDLAANASIFDKLEVPYDVFRKEENQIKRLKEYYRKQLKAGEELWWIDQAEDTPIVSPVIKQLRSFDISVRDRFINECMILFPEIFGQSTTKFERPVVYLVASYNAVTSNIRDFFTAGGQMKVFINGDYLIIPRIMYNLYLRSKEINYLINSIPIKTLSYYWNTTIKSSPLSVWLKMINRYSDIASIVFNAGLQS
jgi:hypothetical protein